jgi:hypothetical protein
MSESGRPLHLSKNDGSVMFASRFLVGYSARRACKLWRGSNISSNVLLYLRFLPL